FVLIAPQFRIKEAPWRRIAAKIASEPHHDEAVFLEAGAPFYGKASSVPDDEYPRGYYSVPFNYYFRGANPEIVLPGWDPGASRRIIAEQLAHSQSAWYITWKDDAQARAALPDGAEYRITQEVSQPKLGIYRVERR